MLRDEIHRHMITLAPWDHHVLNRFGVLCSPFQFGRNCGKMHCWLGLTGGIPALQQEKLCSFRKSHFRSLCMSMPIGETTVKPKTTRQTLQEITFHLSMWPSDSLVPKSLQPNKPANPLAVRVVPAGQDVFLKGRLHEACVLSDDSFYITTTWEGATNKSQSLNFSQETHPSFKI